MKRIFRRLALVAASLAFTAVAVDAVGARPLIPAERRFDPYSGYLPSCDDPRVLSRIQDRFAQKESEYWNSALKIVDYDRVRETGYRSTGADYIPRRYCTARAIINDDKRREVVYWIGEDLGMIGWGFGVEWCVIGLDRNWAYGPACRAAQP
jgi:hypothetical protein